MKLCRLQQQFLSTLCNSSSRKSIAREVVVSKKLSAQEKLAIYRNSMQQNLIKTLCNTYPVCYQLVGEEFFRGMVTKYSEKMLSVSVDLGNYGADLAKFIAKFLPAQSVSYLSDIAKLEWSLHQLSRGKDNAVFDFSQLNHLSEAQQLHVVFELPINSFLLNSQYPIKKIWQLHQPDYQGETTIDFNIDVERLFLCRSGFAPTIQELSNQEWLLLKAIKRGKTVAELTHKQIALLPTLVERGWLSGFHL
jgi:hypothetical protein